MTSEIHITGDVPSMNNGVSSLADNLRVAAGWIDAHPEFETYGVDAGPHGVTVGNYSVHDAEKLVEIARQVGGRWEKDQDDQFFRLRQEIAPGVTAVICVYREAVCERVVVGQHEIEVTEPDPQAVASLPTVTQTKVIEDVEWRCPNLLEKAA
jgi:hypothetical protein